VREAMLAFIHSEMPEALVRYRGELDVRQPDFRQPQWAAA